ncbi:MAG TPA: DNA-directed RNA polymerase subunit A'' [Thermoplasmata archaeon]|nr:DNA-directed RNA polymerase subunit A'' [Thermoplasmata archaeon]
MARTTTIQALRNRGISKKTAVILADAGFTLEKLAASKVERLAKFVSKKEAEKVLKKLGTPPGEAKPAPKKEKAKPAARLRKPAGRAAKAAEAEPEAPLTIPVKAPPLTAGEQEIMEALKEIGRWLPRYVVGEVDKKIHGLKLSKKRLQEVLTKICEKFDLHEIDANESAGIVSAQSIGEPGTQMSLPFETKILIRQFGRVAVLPIGELVDRLMLTHPTSREGPTEWCDLPAGAQLEVPSLSEDGRIVWKAVRAASRHGFRAPLLRIQTRSGRGIVATPNHSFVTRRGGRIVPVRGATLKVGDQIPVVRRWTVPTETRELEMSEVLPQNRYWYGSEVAKARAMGKAWRHGYAKDFVVPAGEDALRRHLQGRSSFPIDDGFVYPFQTHSQTRLPEKMPLDESLGWLLGAYLSEGWAAHYYVNISNTNERFLRRTRAVADSYRVRHAEYENHRGFAKGRDLHLRSVVLADFLRTACGSRSDTKSIPPFAFAASHDCVASLLRAYFEGDGNVSVERGVIRTTSNSKELIDGVSLLLARLGIFSSKGMQNGQYSLAIPARYAAAFRASVGFESKEKRGQLDRLCRAPPRRYTYDALDMVGGFGTILHDLSKVLGLPVRDVRNFTRRQRIGRATLDRFISRFERAARSKGIRIDDALARLRSLRDEDVVWDTITEVADVAPPDRPVYDLSVPGLETFTTAEGVVTHNTMRTFHYAGVAEMNVTLGLPRLIEIVDARRVPSTPIMELYVKTGHTDLEKMRKIATEIEMTSLDDIASIETDLQNMRVLAYPDDHRMRSRGVTWSELEEKLKKFGEVQEVKRQVGNVERRAKALVVEAGEPSFKKLQRLVEQVRSMKIKGIDGISRAIIKKRGEGYVIYTEGSNLSKILELPYVDGSRTSTNSVQEIYEVLGIEAARNAIVNEAYNTLQEQGLTVDIRHIMLVSDMMTNDGDVKAIGRHGISGRKSSVLARAAFEITAHHLLRAAITGEVDYLDGVAENVIVGQPVTLGTGAVNLVYQPPANAQKSAPVPKPKPAVPAAAPPPAPVTETAEPEEPLPEVVP